MNLNDAAEIKAQNNILMIKLATKKTLDWYLEGYENESDRYEWGASDEPRGRELL